MNILPNDRMLMIGILVANHIDEKLNADSSLYLYLRIEREVSMMEITMHAWGYRTDIFFLLSGILDFIQSQSEAVNANWCLTPESYNVKPDGQAPQVPAQPWREPDSATSKDRNEDPSCGENHKLSDNYNHNL